ncbi:MAG TPA: energy transducer TonB [Pseudomonadales bacterium]
MNPCQSLIRNRHPLPVTRSRCAWRITTAALLAALLPAFVHAETAAPEATADAGRAPAVEAPAVRSGMTPLEDVLGEADDPLAPIERQIEAEEFAPAISQLERHIEELEATSHRFDQRLVRPLTLLGDAQAGLGQYDGALGNYQRALHLSRVNLGLNTPEQVEIVYREAETYRALGDYEAANDREEYAYHVLNKVHDPLDEALLPGIYHLADWYRRTNNVFAARALYEQAMQIIDAHGKLESPEAIPALQGIATTYRMERFPPNYMSDMEESSTASASVVTATAVRPPISVNNFPAGEAALQRVIKIRQARKAEQPVALVEAVLDLADWYTLFDKPRRAEPLYAHAWELMSEVDGIDVVRYFSEPQLLYFPAPSNPSPPPPEERGEAMTGYVEVAFDVTEDGYVRGLRTIGSKPEDLMDFRVRKSLRLARYRPMLVDGVPVAKTAHTYRHEFPYYAKREAAPQPQTAAAAGGG